MPETHLPWLILFLPPIADLRECVFVFLKHWDMKTTFALGLLLGLGAECFHKWHSAPTAEAPGKHSGI